MSPIEVLERERLRRRRLENARLRQAMKIATTAGYAAFGAAFFNPIVQGQALNATSFAWAAFGVVALGLSVWYAPLEGDADVVD